MTDLEYLENVATTNNLDVTTEHRTTTRGVMITPITFSVNRVYGDRERVVTYQCLLTVVGADVTNGKLFDTMEALTDGFELDQTAGGTASEVEVDEWNMVEIEKNYTTFRTQITISE